MRASFAIWLPLLASWAVADQCYSTVNGLLAAGNAINPTTILLQLEYTQQAINSGAASVSSAINSACSGATGDAATFCASLQTPQRQAIVAQATAGSLSVLIDCFQAFINGSPDYQLSAGSYYNFPTTPTDPGTTTTTTTTGGGTGPSPLVRSGSKRKRSSAYRTLASMDKVLDFSVCVAKTPFGGISSKRQQTSCSTTADCYRTCRSCQNRDALCSGVPGTAASCSQLGATTGLVTSQLVSVAACGVLSVGCGGLLTPVCFGVCEGLLAPAAAELVATACDLGTPGACAYARGVCNTCNNANGNICAAGTAQCCPTETGTRCGVDCCCCGYGFAPRGANCECVSSP